MGADIGSLRQVLPIDYHLSFSIYQQRSNPITAHAEYYKIFVDKINIFLEILKQHESEPLLINEFIYWYTFDCMGEFGYRIDFGMLRCQQSLEGYEHMRAAIRLLGPFSPAIWIIRLAFAFLPWVKPVRHWNKMLEFSDQCIDFCLKVNVFAHNPSISLPSSN